MRFRVYLRSAPGPWATYDGHVDVVVPLATGAEPGTEREAHECNACGLDWAGHTDTGCCPYCHSGETSELWGTDLEHALKRRAVRHLATTSFPDRPSVASWLLERAEKLS